MNEQLVMDLANNIIWLTLFCLVGGMLIGWYATFTHYRQKEREREAAEDYKKAERIKFPPKSDLDRLRDAMRVLDGIVDYYFIKWDDTEWTYNDGLKVVERHFPLPETNKDKKED